MIKSTGGQSTACYNRYYRSANRNKLFLIMASDAGRACPSVKYKDSRELHLVLDTFASVN